MPVCDSSSYRTNLRVVYSRSDGRSSILCPRLLVPWKPFLPRSPNDQASSSSDAFWRGYLASLHPPFCTQCLIVGGVMETVVQPPENPDRKSRRLNSSHSQISYAVFCLKKKKQEQT